MNKLKQIEVIKLFPKKAKRMMLFNFLVNLHPEWNRLKIKEYVDNKMN